MGVLTIRGLLFGAYIGAPEFGNSHQFSHVAQAFSLGCMYYWAVDLLLPSRGFRRAP